MNGAESLIRTLIASGIDTCFANPGTSEMHFVAALERVPGMRTVLALFEGVATGAADGTRGSPASLPPRCSIADLDSRMALPTFTTHGGHAYR